MFSFLSILRGFGFAVVVVVVLIVGVSVEVVGVELVTENTNEIIVMMSMLIEKVNNCFTLV